MANDKIDNEIFVTILTIEQTLILARNQKFFRAGEVS